MKEINYIFRTTYLEYLLLFNVKTKFLNVEIF